MVMHTPELTSSPSLVWCRSIRLQAHSQRWWERQASSLQAALQKVTAAHLAAELRMCEARQQEFSNVTECYTVVPFVETAC